MDLKKIIEPKSIAVIGISLTNPFNPANVIYNKNKLRYAASTYGVNPKGGMLYGDRVYTGIKEVPETPDLAVIGVKAELVPGILRECIDAGIGGAVIISGGFAEVGKSSLQDEIRDIAREHDFPVIGPNCIGVLSPYVDTFFLPNERILKPERGPVAIISQSGGILVDQMINFSQEHVGLSKAISVGNKAVIDEVDLLKYFGDDEETKVIGIYLEGFKGNRGREFAKVARELGKPVIILKSGKTPTGSNAASSHTASIAGNYVVFSEIMKQSGVLEAVNGSEFSSYCESLACYKNTGVKNICIVTASGGHGVIASDAIYQAGLHLVPIEDDDRNVLSERLSPGVRVIASTRNPIDLTGSARDEDFLVAVKFALEREYVDCIILLLLPYVPGITSDIGARIAQLRKEMGKPVIAYMPRVGKYSIFIEGFEENGIPVAHSVDRTVQMARALSGGKG